MNDRGVAALQLAESLAPLGLKAQDALRAINNWLGGNDHPRCKPAFIRAMAQVLNVRPADICKFTCEVRHHRGSPRKARLLTDLIRGKTYDQAVQLLTFTPKRAALNIKRCLNAAMTDAQVADADPTRLVVCESRVNNGPVIKRFQPKDRGRAHPIHKPLSHITISLEEKPSAR
jgi:large subunit ribosomal protein L22